MCQVSFCLKHNTPKKNGQIPAMCRIAFVKNRYFPTRFGLRACSKFQTLKISKPETPSFKAWNTQFQSLEHPVSRPETPSFKAWNTQFQGLEHPVSKPETPSFKAWNTQFQGLEHLVSRPGTPSFKAWNTQFQGLKHPVSRPGTPSFKAWNTQFQGLEHPVSRPGTPRLQKTKDYADPNTLPASYSKVGTTGQPSSSHVISTRNSLLAPSIRL